MNPKQSRQDGFVLFLPLNESRSLYTHFPFHNHEYVNARFGKSA